MVIWMSFDDVNLLVTGHRQQLPWPWICALSFCIIFVLNSYWELRPGSTDCPWLGADFIAGERPLCVGRNASYVYEIYYCSIGAGSQKICRNIVNTLS
jgi:hypothetical protein